MPVHRLRSARRAGPVPPLSRRRRAVRVVVATLAVLAAAELAYLVAGNLVVATPLLTTLLDRRPEKRQVAWDRAWTVVPGRIHLRGFRLRVQSRPAQWLLTLDRATATVDLPALARRRFHLTSLEADGLSFRLRRRLDTRPEAGVSREAAPPIPGLENPPERPPEDLYPRRRGPGWRIDLDRVAIGGVREIWIDEHRLTGDGRLTGSLALQTRRSLAMEGALRLAGATLHRGDAEVADRLTADLTARFDRFDPTEHRGRAKLRHLSGRLDLRGRVTDLGRLIEPPRRDDGAWLALGGGGDLAAKLGLEQGVIAAGSRLAIDAPRLTVDYLGYRAEGAGRLTAGVAGGNAGDPGEDAGEAARPDLPARLLARLDSFTVRSPGLAEPHVRGAGFALAVRAEAPDLAGPPPAAEIRILLPDSEVPDLTVYNAALPSGSGLAFTGGTGRVGGWLRYSTAERDGSAAVELTADGAAARYRGLPLSGDLRIAARMASFDPRARRFDLAGTAAEVTGVAAGDGAPGWWGRFELPAATLDLGAAAAGRRLDARFTGRARDSGPLLALFATRHPALGWFDGLLTVEDLAVSGRLLAGAEEAAIHDLEVGAGDLGIEGRVHLAAGGHRGLYLTRLGRLTAAVAADGAERQWKLRGAREWYEERLHAMPAE